MLNNVSSFYPHFKEEQTEVQQDYIIVQLCGTEIGVPNLKIPTLPDFY